jgi:hypothetical protein
MPEDDQQQPEVELTPDQARVQTLKILAMNLRSAKRQEESTKANRIAVEETIAALIPGKEDGQVTETLPDGSKIVVKRGFNYRANLKGIEEIFNGLDGLPAPIKIEATRKLEVAGYEWYRRNHLEIFQQMIEHVTVTPKKVAVELKDPKGE